jgi:predicted RNA-binding Zn ribbon-like protein
MYDGCAMHDEMAHSEPGEREPAPAALRLVQDFVNTNDLEGEEDALGTAAQLRDWLVQRDLLERDAQVPPDAHRRALEIREGLRALGRANNEESLDSGLVDAMNRASKAVPLHLARDGDGWALQPSADGVDAFLGRILGAVASADADGSWSRVKACRNDTCRWLFYDHSRNRSSTWCTMAICGSRMKARAYRARQREEADA